MTYHWTPAFMNMVNCVSFNEVVSSCHCSISPLKHAKGPTEAAIEFAKAGVPVYFLPMPQAGATGHMTLAGSTVACMHSDFTFHFLLCFLFQASLTILLNSSWTLLSKGSG
jgi:hypothetical protein